MIIVSIICLLIAVHKMQVFDMGTALLITILFATGFLLVGEFAFRED